MRLELGNIVMKSRVIVTAIIEKDGKYLLGQKPKGVGVYPDTWHLIGGGLDMEDESMYEGLQREIREEAHIEVTDIKRISFDEDYTKDDKGEEIHFIFLVFHAIYLSGDPQPGDDIERLQWFSKEEIKKIPLTQPSTKYFKEIGWI